MCICTHISSSARLLMVRLHHFALSPVGRQCFRVLQYSLCNEQRASQGPSTEGGAVREGHLLQACFLSLLLVRTSTQQYTYSTFEQRASRGPSVWLGVVLGQHLRAPPPPPHRPLKIRRPAPAAAPPGCPPAGAAPRVSRHALLTTGPPSLDASVKLSPCQNTRSVWILWLAVSGNSPPWRRLVPAWASAQQRLHY